MEHHPLPLSGLVESFHCCSHSWWQKEDHCGDLVAEGEPSSNGDWELDQGERGGPVEDHPPVKTWSLTGGSWVELQASATGGTPPERSVTCSH